ncbi:PIN domain-like protein [Pluteus cervinus]|uniref:PIN domain-like protein n=1 Tax=Pluteus cervinus TaxID=181527 RepID=A0ACD3B5Z9_9AGAR|nr:PIN domain-like protein [Pluteus cervinus]
MGVKDLVNVIRKHCPSLIQELPNRFQELTGKTVVIDATLLTQRFHFARNPHPHRHLIGWYHLVKELEESKVNAICVFDGKLRSPAKWDEIKRRKEGQRLVLSRLNYEEKRQNRLRRLTSRINDWFEADDSTRGELSSEIAQIANMLSLTRDKQPESIWVSPVSSADRELQKQIESAELPEELGLDLDAPCLRQDALDADAGDEIQDTPQTPTPPSQVGRQSTIEVREMDTVKPIDDVIDTRPTTPLEVVLEKLEISDEIEERKPLTLSTQPLPLTQHQQDMTLKEDQALQTLAFFGVEPEISDICIDDAKGSLEEVIAESGELAETLKKRSSPPTRNTYSESVELLEAMGIPCITVTDTVEAEALAASMVKHGQADYVVTEDSDVLVYGVSMLRNVTSRQEPISVISGTNIASSLNLDDSSFIDFVILLGNDFVARIRNVGPARGLLFIRKHQSIERILEEEAAYPLEIPKDVYMRKVAVARDIFRTHPPVPDVSLLSRKKDQEKVTRLLERYNLGSAILDSDNWQVVSTFALDGNYFGDDPNAT